MYPKKVRIVQLNYPLRNHKYSRTAAAAALAAGKQGKFWELNDLLLNNFNKLNDQFIVTLAGGLDLDMERFDRDRKSQDIAGLIDRDLTQGPKHGVQGTPTVFINGKLLGNRSLEGISHMIDRELGRKKPTYSGGSSPVITPPARNVNAQCG